MNPAQTPSGSPVQPPAKSLLSECREIAQNRLSEVVAAALAKIDEDLFQLADKSVKRAEQQVYLDAMTRVRRHRTEIQRKFEECFRAIYDKRLDGGKAEPKPLSDAGPGFGGIELSLVSDSIIENGIAIDRLAKGVMGSLDNQELLGIRARFGHLLNRDSLEDADNPLSPEAIFEALKLACQHIPAEDAVKQALLGAFQPYLSRSITQIYHAVNESLLAHHVLPRIRHAIKSGTDPMGVSQRMTGMSATQRMSALSQSGRMAQFDTGGSERAGWQGGGNFGEQFAIAGILAALTQGHSSARGDGLRMLSDPVRFAGNAVGLPASTNLLEVLARLQSDANLGAGAGAIAPGFLRDIDRALLSNGTPLDQLTIELVSVVFDHLHGNDKVAEPIKGLIARLQIVAVRAAILDRSFFASRQHPMRRLLDCMAEAGSDPAVSLADDGAFMQGVRHLVDDLAVQFKDDLGIFTTALTELEVLVRQEHAVAEAATREQAEALAEQEVATAADAAARADLAARCDASTPAFVHEFLMNHWRVAVADAQVRGLEGDDSVAARLNLAADLIWSVQPKSRTDIPTLAAMLPKLVRGLMRGVAALRLDEISRQSFFNQLMQAHTAAIAAAKSSAPDMPSQPAPAADRAAPELRPVALVASGDAFARTVVELAKGENIAFSDQSPDDRYKLTWISPKRSFYLFTGGNRMRQMSADMLAELLRKGLATIIEPDAPLLDRTLEAIASSEQPVEWAA